ncbi:hypothetical protein V6N12_046218 [Hibiscus sabdariffa]|uniref:Uncharacterized protein n=1 Tax=Hibiscus sabdariffa TaxID=183260 RepID=A0ABR2AD08_9ROSI
MGYAMDADEDEFLVVGERINVAVENEGVGDGHVAPIGTEKVSYANMVVESKGLDEDVARVLGLIDKDVFGYSEASSDTKR